MLKIKKMKVLDLEEEGSELKQKDILLLVRSKLGASAELIIFKGSVLKRTSK